MRWDSEVPSEWEAEGRRLVLRFLAAWGMAAPCRVSDCRRWECLEVGCGSLDVPVRHPAEMSLVVG